MEKRSLGLIETWGFVPAIEAADAGTKAAKVRLLGYEVVPVGRVMVAFVGDVAAVKAAVRSGSAAAERVGQVLAVHVIPRPDRQLRVEPPSKPLLPPNGERGPRPGPPESPSQEDEQQAEPDSPPTAPVEESRPAPESPKDKASKKSSKSSAKRDKASGKNESEPEKDEQADDHSSDT